MKLKTILSTFCVALMAGFAPAALGQAGPVYYLDVNGNSPGFGDPNDLSIDGSDTNWTTDATGDSQTVALPAWYTSNYNPVQLDFGSPGTAGITNSTFTITAEDQLVSDISLNVPCNVTLASFAVLNFLSPLTWSVPTGSTFSVTYNAGNWGFGNGTLTMLGGGTINFDCNDIGRNAPNGYFIQEMTNGVVNLTDAYYDSTTAQGSYDLAAGTLNFATSASAGAIGGSSEASSQYFKISGGTLDNTSGGEITLNLGYASYLIAGSFVFAGSSSLDLGPYTVDLGTVTPTITVSNNMLEIDGVVSDTAGLTVAGAGTLLLTAANTYTGNTTVSGGTLALGGGGSIASSPLISIAAGATFDVSSAGWSGSGSQALAPAGTSGTGTVNAGGQSVTLNSGDALSFQAIGGSSPAMGQINVAGASGSLNLNNNTVTINVSGSKLGAGTNTLVTVTGTLNGTANPVPSFMGLGLADGTGAQILTTSGSPGSVVLIVTNAVIGSQVTTTTVALTTGANPEAYGGQLTFTATVTGATTTPSGSVIFKDGANSLAMVTLTPGTSPSSTATYTEYTSLDVVGSPHSITASYSGDAAHALSDSSASPVAQTITVKSLTYSGLTAGSTSYNGTNVATLGGTPVLQAAEAPGTGSTSDGIPYTGDSVTTGGTAAGVLASKNVGTQPVTVTGVTLAGADAGDYTVVQQTGLVQIVTNKVLVVVGLAITNPPPALTGTASFQTYEAPGGGTGYDGNPYAGDAVSLGGTAVGSLATNSAEFNLVVDVSGLSLTGAGASNYSLQEPVLYGPSQNGPAYYLDVNGSNPGTGFGDPTGQTIDGNDSDWTTDSTGNSPTEALPPLYNASFTYLPVQLTFGNPGTTGISNSTFTVNSEQFIAGVVFNVPCTATLTDFGLIDFEATTAWYVPTNCTFNVDVDQYRNWAFANLLLEGNGTINFNCQNLGRNAGNFIQEMNGGTVNVMQAYSDTVGQASYELRNGELNFAAAGAAAAFGGPGTPRYLKVDGGTILDNTSGGGLTLNLGSATFQVAGSFVFAGSSSLDLGSGPVDLGTMTPTITVSNSTLEVDGVVSDTAGLTKAGAGTLLLTAANTYTGNTTVNGGILEVGQATLATNSTITVASGAILQMDFAVTNTVNNLVLNGARQPAGVYSTTTSSPYLAGTGSLLVLGTATAPATTNITYSVSGNKLILNWPAGQGWQLMAQTNTLGTGLTTHWFPVTGATPPYTNNISPANPAVFYRLTYP
jgi:fibronectin-binding autotransporter adhesin